jgi:hypothetical protein
MRVLAIILGVAVLGVVVLVIRAGGGDDGLSEQERALRQIQRQTSAAYDCMPRDVRRRFDVTIRRYETSFGQTIDRLPDDAEPAEVDRALRTDPDVRRRRAQARRILVDYLPGGDEFDADCFARAARRFDRRLAREQAAE